MGAVNAHGRLPAAWGPREPGGAAAWEGLKPGTPASAAGEEEGLLPSSTFCSVQTLGGLGGAHPQCGDDDLLYSVHRFKH